MTNSFYKLKKNNHWSLPSKLITEVENSVSDTVSAVSQDMASQTAVIIYHWILDHFKIHYLETHDILFSLCTDFNKVKNYLWIKYKNKRTRITLIIERSRLELTPKEKEAII